KDIAINNVNVSQTSFEDAPVSIQADVTAAGYSGSSVIGQVLEIAQGSSLSPRADGSRQTNRPNASAAESSPSATSRMSEARVVAEQTQKVRSDREPVIFRFQIR